MQWICMANVQNWDNVWDRLYLVKVSKRKKKKKKKKLGKNWQLS